MKEPVADGVSDLVVLVTVDCTAIEPAPGGLRIRDRERFEIRIPPEFPFAKPEVWVGHTRWAGAPHVQWSRYLCLYLAPAVEWNPSAGMYGLLDRLWLWLGSAARGELDPEGAPLHPPAVYPTENTPIVIPRVDTPPLGASAWWGVAHLDHRSDKRIEITDWSRLGEAWPAEGAPAFLLSKPISWEYPRHVRDLLEALEQQGIERRAFLSLLSLGALHCAEGRPMYVVIGTPMRGEGDERRQHLAVWELNSVLVDGFRLLVEKHSDNPELRRIGDDVEQILLDWAEGAALEWCPVYEDRPEVTRRRDEDSPLEFFHGKTVAIWGCGAAGAPMAEHLARSGVVKLILYDNDIVKPGILVRQPYSDAQIRQAKAYALRDRLNAFGLRGLEIEANHANVLTSVLDGADWDDDADVLIDATASTAVSAKLEKMRRRHPSSADVVSVIFGHTAERGMATVSASDSMRGPADVTRQTKLVCCRRPELRDFANEFWPATPRQQMFQPEPGCSEPTFTGSSAESAALAATLLVSAAADLAALRGGQEERATARLVALPNAAHAGRRDYHLQLPEPFVIDDPIADYQVRLAESAQAEIRAWISQNNRANDPASETGGLLFGERDDATKILWIDEVIGPPPDSESSPEKFVCGTEGVEASRDEKRKRSRKSLTLVGGWHTHPGGTAAPSTTDILAMATIILPSSPRIPKSLLLIVGGTLDALELGTYVFDRDQLERPEGIKVTSMSVQVPAPVIGPKNVGLALSGGGSRAVAFHLGCLRALHDRGVLDRLQVISGVSGGGLMTALFAYTDGDFQAFDDRVREVLRRGVSGAIARRAFLTWRLPATLGSLAVSGLAAAGARLVSAGSTVAARAARRPGLKLDVQPPLRRWSSRTDAFRDALRSDVFGEAQIGDSRRGDVDVVINACELRTASAFRYGNQESGCWRIGTLTHNEVQVADAVAASAAYPLALPALDDEMSFLTRGGDQRDERVVLTDGGVFDNLGTSCMEPGRSASISTNVFTPDYIISCDAGRGLMDDEYIPYFLPSRLRRSFEAVFRKVQDATRGRLHQYAASGEIDGFILPYLGQQDSRLPIAPADLVPREAVVDYPTNFSPMSEEQIELLARRGEQLTRLLIDLYLPEL